MRRAVQRLFLCLLSLLLISIFSPIDLASSTIEQAVDRNGNCIIEDEEILRAVGYWITGDPLPGTPNLTVDEVRILDLVDLWISEKCISVAPLPVDRVFLVIINEHRSQSDRCFDLATQSWVPWEGSANRQLALASSLNEAAVYHSQFMADHDCFAHQCPGEVNLPARLAQFGYTEWTAYGENLAAGVEGSEAVFELWKNSSPHNRNMLSCQFEELGVGRVFDSGDGYPSAQAPLRWYWTADFGSHQ